MMLLRGLALIGLPLLVLSTPAFAVTAKDKMETCKFGAQAENLTGAKATAFVKRCMAGGNYEPAARRNMAKGDKGAKGAKTTSAPKPAPKQP